LLRVEVRKLPQSLRGGHCSGVLSEVAAGNFHRNCEEAFMKVKEVMTPDAKTIWITESLADAAKEMWENDCGILPIIKDGRKVIGMITDRDICMATAIRDRNPSSISVEEVMNATVYAVEADEEVEQALQTMREHKIRRLPVLNLEGELEGIVSMNDIVLKAKERNGKKPQIAYADVVKTYQAICEHPLPMVQAATAE
jgi:CBS-domain-containing membrane protein